jgi:hypothetical protein
MCGRSGACAAARGTDLAAVDLIDRDAQAEGVARKDVVNLAVHEGFERRHYRPGETPGAMAPWAEEPACNRERTVGRGTSPTLIGRT